MIPGYYFRHINTIHQSLTIKDWLPGFLGAFTGAFFAFIFGLLTFYFGKKRERFIKHKNALVRIEFLLNEHADESNLAKIHADTTKNILEKGALTDYRFILFKLPDNIAMELGSADILNRYFAYSRMITRLNADFAAKNLALTRLEDAVLAGKKTERETTDYMVYSMTEISKGLDRLFDDIKNFLAVTRIYLRKMKNHGLPFYGMFSGSWDFIISDAEISEEIKKLEGEVERIRNEAADKLAKQI